MKSVCFITLIISGFILSPIVGQGQLEIDALLRSNRDVPKVLLVGTFHFGYPDLDAHKTSEAYKVDIQSPQRQKEVEELVEYIATYKPTKIMVEAGINTGSLLNRYRD